MGTRLTVFNQKGGVGKTTTVLNLGAALARRGAVPLLVDLDAQSHLSSILNPGPRAGKVCSRTSMQASRSRRLPGRFASAASSSRRTWS